MLAINKRTRALPNSQIEPKPHARPSATVATASFVGTFDPELAMRLRIAVAHSRVSHIRRRLGVNKATYEAMLAGRQPAPLPFLVRFCEVLSISPKAIFDAAVPEILGGSGTQELEIHIRDTRGFLDLDSRQLASSAGKRLH